MLKTDESSVHTSSIAPLKNVVSILGSLFIGISIGASVVRYYEIDLKRDMHWLTMLAWTFSILFLTAQQILIRKEKRDDTIKPGEKLRQRINARSADVS
jgi:hypothetical protein